MKTFAIGLLSLILLGVGTNATVTPSRRATNETNETTGLTAPSDVNMTLTGDTALVPPCFWAGFSPDCSDAGCPSGYEDCGRDPCGGGPPCCTQGQKISCCLISAGVC